MPVSDALGVDNRTHGQALKERAPGDVFGELLDRDSGLDPPDVRLGQHELIERNVARRAQDDLANGL